MISSFWEPLSNICRGKTFVIKKVAAIDEVNIHACIIAPAFMCERIYLILIAVWIMKVHISTFLNEVQFWHTYTQFKRPINNSHVSMMGWRFVPLGCIIFAFAYNIFCYIYVNKCAWIFNALKRSCQYFEAFLLLISNSICNFNQIAPSWGPI